MRSRCRSTSSELNEVHNTPGVVVSTDCIVRMPDEASDAVGSSAAALRAALSGVMCVCVCVCVCV